MHHTGYYPVSREISCAMQDSFRQTGKYHAPCREYSGKPELFLHHAIHIPVNRNYPCIILDSFWWTGKRHARCRALIIKIYVLFIAINLTIISIFYIL
jgi:hypothetical protein